jgi:hypothetical protein
MKAELGDKVTLTGLVAQRFFASSGPDTLEILLNDDRRIRLPADYEFASVQKPPYRPKVGEWFTWGAGHSGYQCLWIEGEHVLYGRWNKSRPTLGDVPDMPRLRPCEDSTGDRR